MEELTEKFTMEELRQWAAYERTCDSLDDQRIEELIALVHEQLQLMNWLFAEKHFAGKGEGNTVHLNPLGKEPVEPVKRVSSSWRFNGPAEVVAGTRYFEPPEEDEDQENNLIE